LLGYRLFQGVKPNLDSLSNLSPTQINDLIEAIPSSPSPHLTTTDFTTTNLTTTDLTTTDLTTTDFTTTLRCQANYVAVDP
jgi:uncharacterized protein YjbI with pentapeptide repeats